MRLSPSQVTLLRAMLLTLRLEIHYVHGESPLNCVPEQSISMAVDLIMVHHSEGISNLAMVVKEVLWALRTS